MFIPPSAIDNLYEYTPLLNEEPLCKIPKQALGSKVAVIGAGAAGITVAYELLRMGLKPIIYEASPRIGGRLYSRPFEQIQSDHKPFAELGAMRIPLSSRVFFYYASKIKLNCDLSFPSHGDENTAIYYSEKLHSWGPHAKLPLKFKQTDFLWNLFSSQLVRPIREIWEEGDLESVKQLWQMYIDQYSNKSLYEVLRERSPLTGAHQISIFGASGMTSSGFSSVFQISFLELLRVLINGYSHNQVFSSRGSQQFVELLYRFPVYTEEGAVSLESLDCLKLNTPIVQVDYNMKTKNPVVIIKDKANNYHAIEYRAIVFTGSMTAANLINLNGKTKSGVFLFNEKVRDAIINTPMVAASKSFICTKNKFWLEKKMPTTYLTNDLPRATYFLDYPHTKYGVVCLSYTWGMDALKLSTVDPKDRVVIFKRSLNAISPNMTKMLVPVNDEIITIDWMSERYQHGAFRLSAPGSDARQQALYFQFQSVLTEEDRGIYLAGDSVSLTSGWVESALCCGINAVYAVAKRLGAKLPRGTPLDQNPKLYHY